MKPKRHRPEQSSRISAFFGAIAWLLLLAVPLALTERLLLLAILVFTPLALALAASPPAARRFAHLYDIARYYQPFAAALTTGAFFLPAGLPAALLASSWLLFTMLVGLFGLSRLLAGQSLRADRLCVDAGMLFLPVGGAWLAMTRLGAQPLGFGETITLLTAVHFHYAGFTVPVLAGMAGRILMERTPPIRWMFQCVATGIISGVPLVALGITFSRVLEVAAVFVLAASLMGLALLIVAAVVPRVSRGLSRALLTISALASVFTMLLAVGYATGNFTGLAITIPQMVLAHGVVNAFGVVLCGLLGWTFETANKEAL